MSKNKGLLLDLFAWLLAGSLLAACQNNSDYTAPAPTIPENAMVLNLAKNAATVSGEGYVRFHHAIHNAKAIIHNDCMKCHIHTAVTVSPSWPCAKCHSPGGIAAGRDVCSNPEVSAHGQSCITRACFDCHADPTKLSQNPADYAYGLAPTDCHFCHAYKATFADSVVEGAQYNTPTWSGKTNVNGIFEYHNGETLQFTAGGVTLGSLEVDTNLNVKTKGFITPVDLVVGATDETNQTVTNIARFLLTIDADGDSLNGITIPTDLGSVVNGRAINFAVDPTSFGNDANLLSVLAHYGNRALVSVVDAQSHLNNTIANGP